MTEGTVPLRSALAGGVLTLTLDRPEKRNALSLGLVEALHTALERADLDADARVIVLRGAGRDFCAGADLDGEAEALARTLAAASPSALALTKQLFYQLDGRTVEGGVALGARINALARQTPDFRAAIAQFLKR